ncbi:hypothetical protein SPHINGO391_350042 [Sphingomonas aurantiaca]|uniref:Uncharacterized protein n=1 Tax=Sphingomonas aurantiaca TaxID=185949 RepID=A0A5E7Y0N6_9SPHN|nr:hypothetical protein SPHINGO391_350042 [Sphingomonas aurantiaca]
MRSRSRLPGIWAMDVLTGRASLNARHDACLRTCRKYLRDSATGVSASCGWHRPRRSGSRLTSPIAGIARAALTASSAYRTPRSGRRPFVHGPPSARRPASRRPASRGQPVGLGVVDGSEHVAFGLHGTEVLAHGLGVPVAWETAIGSCSDRKLTNKVAPVLLRDKPLPERGLRLLLLVVVIGHSRVLDSAISNRIKLAFLQCSSRA